MPRGRPGQRDSSTRGCASTCGSASTRGGTSTRSGASTCGPPSACSAPATRGQGGRTVSTQSTAQSRPYSTAAPGGPTTRSWATVTPSTFSQMIRTLTRQQM